MIEMVVGDRPPVDYYSQSVMSTIVCYSDYPVVDAEQLFVA